MRIYRHIFLALFSLFAAGLFAQRETIHFLIKEKARIDKVDGKLDGKIKLNDPNRSALAQKVYFGMVDSIWVTLQSLEISDVQRDSLTLGVYFKLTGVHGRELPRLEHDARYFSNVWHILRGIRNEDLAEVLRVNEYMSLQQISFYAYRPEAEDFLLSAASFYPVEVMRNFYQYRDRPWAAKVVEQAASLAPNIAKKYIIPNNAINDILQESNDLSVKSMLYITQTLGKTSSAYNLIDAIATGELTIEQADNLTKQSFPYLQQMIRSRIKRHPYAEYSLEKELELEALKYVRVMNDLHNENDKVRYAAIENFNAPELYTLIVYSEEEIFTSSFNYTFARLLQKLSTQSRYDFLKSLGFNRYRTFIKQCASFGKLEEFLSTMSAEEQKRLMMLFVSGLDDETAELGEAVEVADAYSGIKDPLLADYVLKNIEQEYKRAQLNENKEGMIIYGLLASLFASGNTFDEQWYASVAQKYQIPPITSIEKEKLFQPNLMNIWQVYFYDDEDGAASFSSFMAQFRNDKNWRVSQETDLFVAIDAVDGAPVTIYANKPEAEYEGQAYVEHLLDSLEVKPDVLIHRGHSYYAYKTIEKIKPNTKIFVLGSCGGYNSLSTVIQLSPDVSIISSKQIGVQGVNNPLLKMLADDIRSQVDINWENLWSRLDKKLKGTPSYSRFLDYIPPHKNVGAIFIRSYMRLSGAIQ